MNLRENDSSTVLDAASVYVKDVIEFHTGRPEVRFVLTRDISITAVSTVMRHSLASNHEFNFFQQMD